MTLRLKLTLLLSLLLHVAAGAHAQAPANAENQLLQLETRVTPGATFLIDPVLLDDAGPLIERMSAGLIQQAALYVDEPAPATDREDYLAAINRLLGQNPAPALRKQQAEIFDFFLQGVKPRFAAGDRLHVTIVTAADAKAHLRAGGSLPHSTYDAGTDTVTVKYQLTAQDGGEVPVLKNLMVAVRPGDELLTAGDHWLQLVGEMREAGLLVALHEVAEFTFVAPWIDRRVDPHWRWFSDGLADAIALRVMDDAGDHDAAASARHHRDTAAFGDLRGEANLRYWLEATHQPEIKSHGEDRLSLARYAFALEEVQRLIDTHGTEWIARVAVDLNDSPTPGSQAILESIRQHTGEVMDERLDRYQPFATPEAGLTRYTDQVAFALRLKDYATALPPAIRRLEIVFDRVDPRTRETQRVIAGLLLDLGEKAQAKKVRQTVLSRLHESRPGLSKLTAS